MVEISIDTKLLLGCVCVLVAWPLDPADITKLISTSAPHAPASLASFDDHPALDALPVPQVLLKKVDFVLIALPLMGGEHALAAELFVAGLTTHCWLFALKADYSVVTLAAGAQSQIRILESAVEGHHLLRLALGLCRQLAEKVPLHVHGDVAIFSRTDDLLKPTYLVQTIFLEATHTELMLAFGNRGRIFLEVISFADSAFESSAFEAPDP